MGQHGMQRLTDIWSVLPAFSPAQAQFAVRRACSPFSGIALQTGGWDSSQSLLPAIQAQSAKSEGMHTVRLRPHWGRSHRISFAVFAGYVTSGVGLGTELPTSVPTAGTEVPNPCEGLSRRGTGWSRVSV